MDYSKNGMVSAEFEDMLIPTYVMDTPMDIPFFFEKKPYQGATGRLYPLPFSDSLGDTCQSISYKSAVLENEHIRVEMLPEIGGKIFRAYDKHGKYDFIYYNSVIKPALIGLAGPWISGGIEFNWPQHHRPTTFMPLDAAFEEMDNGEKTIWMGEVEPINRMKGMVGISLCPGRSFIKAKVRLYNRTPFAHPFMWWANLAVPANENYRVTFPPDVEWVNDHDRRAVIGWPIAKGIYKTARPFDYGEGTDLSNYTSIIVPSSFMVPEGESEMDFVSGYDHGKQSGIVAYADHNIAPGKKLFHWGTGDFGDMWCSNLTDEDGPYVELMTGAYTDNQPDFSWILPYETKTFEQYWYPIRAIGDVKNATIDAAINLEQQNSGVFIGCQSTGEFPNSKIILYHFETPVWECKTDLAPDRPYTKRIAMKSGWELKDLVIALYNSDGNMLVSYKATERGKRCPPTPREAAKPPRKLGTADELFINGLHLEQYKHHTYDPRDYYSEALRRDPGDIRCNTAMGRLELRDGNFDRSITFFDRAIERLTSRNNHPFDVEAIYLKGLALRYLKQDREAEKEFCRALWHYEYRSAAYYELAAADARKGFYDAALEKLELSLSTNCQNLSVLNMRASLLRNKGCTDMAYAVAQDTAKNDPLDLWSRFETLFASSQAESHELTKKIDEEIRSIFTCNPEAYLDVVCSYMHAGLYADALSVLDFMSSSYPLVGYYQAMCHHLTGGDAMEYIRAAEAERGVCFPSRLEDIAVLDFAIKSDPKASRAHYYMGCLLYDRFRYEEAIVHWELAIDIDPGFAHAFRNLAIAYFDKRGDFKGARECMETALRLKPKDARILYELQQILKNSDISSAERIGLYEQYFDLMKQRDDCYLDGVMLYTVTGDYHTAVNMLRTRTFHIYEGGEGKLTRQHAWIHVLYGNRMLAEGDKAQAEKMYRDGLVIPKEYGEAKSYFAQESHIYYFLGNLLEQTGRIAEAKEAYRKAGEDKATVSEVSLFRALALRKLSHFSQAEKVLDEMLAEANSILAEPEKYKYFGVGAPTPAPFEYDIRKINLVDGHVLKAYAMLGLGRTSEAEQEIENARILSKFDYRIYSYDQICSLI